MRKLEKDRDEMQLTIATLQKMSLVYIRSTSGWIWSVIGGTGCFGGAIQIRCGNQKDLPGSWASGKNSARSVGIQNSSVQLLTILSEGELEDIMKWLSPIEPRKRHQEIASKRLEGTGDWFDRTDDFQNWQNTSGVGSEAWQVFGCYGKPGAGKSIIWLG